jgi:bifunctional non-homologous end joining protein LigD
MAGGLDTYRTKRDFSKTPEPAPSRRRAKAGRGYLIQKHDATRLHYDLRLEHDGVLLSWAVTRGPSLDPSQKRLAVRTEDHPVSYGSFEGVIPQGQYGAGTVMLWDRGSWEPLKDDVDAALEAGELSFRLNGERLKGEWALVRMNREGKRENWLLIKKSDAHAGTRDAANLASTSIASGRTMAAIAKSGAKTGGRPPKFREPALCRLVDAPPEGEDWLHELKYDGYRLLAAVGGGKARLFTRSGKDWSDRFTALCEDLRGLDAGSALIDGEAAVLENGGLSDFSALQAALSGDGDGIVFFAFDLLEQDGEDLTKLPLIDRKSKLKALLKGAKGAVRYADHVAGHGDRVFDKACAMGAEGIISKRADAPYRGGRTGGWLKIKCEHREEAVIIGWSPSDKDREFASLLLATFEDGDWVYRGRVGTGFDAAARADIAAKMSRLTRRTAPADVPRAIARDAVWVAPKLVAELRYTERTPDGLFRHPAFLGLREDKKARDVSAEPEGGDG